MQIRLNNDAFASMPKIDMSSLKVGQKLPVEVVSAGTEDSGKGAQIKLGGQQIEAQLDTAARPGERFWVAVRELSENGLILSKGQAMPADVKISPQNLLALLSRGLPPDSEIAALIDKFQNNPQQLTAVVRQSLETVQNPQLKEALAQLLKMVPQWEGLSAKSIVDFLKSLGVQHENQAFSQLNKEAGQETMAKPAVFQEGSGKAATDQMLKNPAQSPTQNQLQPQTQLPNQTQSPSQGQTQPQGQNQPQAQTPPPSPVPPQSQAHNILGQGQGSAQGQPQGQNPALSGLPVLSPMTGQGQNSQGTGQSSPGAQTLQAPSAQTNPGTTVPASPSEGSSAGTQTGKALQGSQGANPAAASSQFQGAAASSGFQGSQQGNPQSMLPNGTQAAHPAMPPQTAGAPGQLIQGRPAEGAELFAMQMTRSAVESDTVKAKLIKLLEATGQQLTQGDRVAAKALLDDITAQQLWLQSGLRKNAFVLMHMPLQNQEGLHEARIAVESARKGTKMDPTHCRIGVQVDTYHLGTVGADVWLYENRIHLCLLSDDVTDMAGLIQSVLDDEQEHFQALGMFLASVTTKDFADMPRFRSFLAGEQMEVNVEG